MGFFIPAVIFLREGIFARDRRFYMIFTDIIVKTPESVF